MELGNDLGRLLPVELVKLRHPRLHGLAMRDLLERKAMQYALTGKERLGKGPLVLLLDRSWCVRPPVCLRWGGRLTVDGRRRPWSGAGAALGCRPFGGVRGTR